MNADTSLLKRGEHVEALEAARNAIDLAPEKADHLSTLALALEATGDKPAALQMMEKAVRLDERYQPQLEKLRQR